MPKEARALVAVDLSEDNAKRVAVSVGGVAVGADVSDEDAMMPRLRPPRPLAAAHAATQDSVAERRRNS